MKKIILLLLLVSGFVNAQITLSEKDLKFNQDLKVRLEDLKKTTITSEEIRNLMVFMVDKIAKNAPDPLLRKDANDYLEKIKFQKLDVDVKISKDVDLSKVPKEVLKNFRINEDKFNSTTFIYNKNTNPRLHLYIGIKYKNPYLRLVCKYDGKDWIFFKNIVFLIDGIRYDYKPLKVEREAYLGGLYEKSDNLVFETDMELINALANAKESIDIRFVGDKVYDCTFGIKKVENIKETLDLYNSFK